MCKSRGDLISLYKYLKSVPNFSVVASDRTRSRAHKLKHKKFHLNARKNFFRSRVAEQWNRLPRQVVESRSLETFQVILHGTGIGGNDLLRFLPAITVL